MPAKAFVKAINDNYYIYFASEYEATHPDVVHDAATAWKRIADVLKSKLTNMQEYTIVDIGSGTGFVASRLLEECLPFKNYIGFEPSSDMRNAATQRLKDRRLYFKLFDISKDDMFFPELKAIEGKKIITLNSVLHHIVWWEDFLTVIKNTLNTGDLLILCHEPNSRFCGNETLVRFFDSIQEEKMRRNLRAFYLNPMNYIQKIRRLMRMGGYTAPSKYDLINKELKVSGVIKKDLLPALISAIIDYGVPLCWRGINIEKEYDEGFYCIESLMEDYFKDMEILLSFTYQHLAFSPVVLSPKWRLKEKALEEEYPMYGAQFCLVIQKS